MSEYPREPQVLDWDSRHFGVRMARFGPREPQDVPQALEWATTQGIGMVMARCGTTEVPVIHRLEASGFLLMDTFVRYAFDLTKKEIPEDTGKVPVRSFESEDIPAIGRVASRSFEGYRAHFHNDPRLPKDRCDALYKEWAVNSCRDERLADDVLVAVRDGDVVGFTTMKGLGEKAAEGVLFGVDPSAQGLGIGRSVVIHGMRWSKKRGFQRMEVDSLVNNYAVQRVWERLGFEVYDSGHTFHRWMDGRST